jgi:Secretion system C-terminal sorting domain
VLPAGSPNCPNFTGDLTASLVGKNTVSVQWTTSQPEFDKYMYTVEHSTNMNAWDKVASVIGQHDETKPNHYSVLHQTPVSGMNYYRVKRENEVGVTSFSPIEQLDLDVALSSSIGIYPNPVSTSLIIKNVVEYDADVPVEIINTSGDVLHTLIIKQGTLQYEELPVENLPSGLYMVRIRFPNGDVRTVKITKF